MEEQRFRLVMMIYFTYRVVFVATREGVFQFLNLHLCRHLVLFCHGLQQRSKKRGASAPLPRKTHADPTAATPS